MALEYARGGLPVIALHSIGRDGACTCARPDCRTPGKHPRSAHGLDDATTDMDVVAQWWSRRPDSNVGARPIPGTFALDVDPRSGGDRELAALLEAHGPLPRTMIAETGSGGLHVWLAYRGAVPGKLAPGLDLKGASGYLVMPPSVHASGGRYRWALSAPIAPAPAWLRERLAGPPRRRRTPRTVGRRGASLTGLVRFVSESVEGERNARLYWAACRAAEGDLDPAPLIDAAIETGLEEYGATATVESARRRVEREGVRR